MITGERVKIRIQKLAVEEVLLLEKEIAKKRMITKLATRAKLWGDMNEIREKEYSKPNNNRMDRTSKKEMPLNMRLLALSSFFFELLSKSAKIIIAAARPKGVFVSIDNERLSPAKAS